MEEERRGIESYKRRESVPVGFPSEELWKFILDREKIPQRLMMQLKGFRYVYSEEAGKWVHEKIGDPWMNDKGVKWVISVISPYCEPTTTVTKLTKEEVNDMTKEIMNSVVAKFEQCWEEFKIRKSNLLAITRLIEQIIFLNLSASREGTILESIIPRYAIQEIYKPEEKKSRWRFPSFFGGK